MQLSRHEDDEGKWKEQRHDIKKLYHPRVVMFFKTKRKTRKKILIKK